MTVTLSKAEAMIAHRAIEVWLMEFGTGRDAALSVKTAKAALASIKKQINEEKTFAV